MGLYFLALPLGGGLGYVIGGRVAHWWDWRAAFLVVGIPGLVAAIAGLLIHDPGRGASEGTLSLGRPTAQPERVYRPVPYPDVCVQHVRYGRSHLRHRGTRGLGVDLLPDRSRNDREGRQRLDWRDDLAGGLDRDQPGNMACRPDSQADPTALYSCWRSPPWPFRSFPARSACSMQT